MRKIYSLVLLSALLLVLSASYISACGYNDHHDCNLKSETIVEGKITYADTDDLAGKAKVTVTCEHDGKEYKRTTMSVRSGGLKGTYFVTFPQKQCVDGDKVTVVASKNGVTGTNEGEVEDSITEKCLDMDVAIVDVPLVPEFGAVVGALTVLGALGTFFVVRRK